MPDGTLASYDEVPYESDAFESTHPDQLATVATLFGMQPTPLGQCRVLELGCASGGNLIPMAQVLPHSHFVGIDLSRRQIEDARNVIDVVGLTNVELKHANILDVNAEYGKFDYIIAHGVYSWVPPETQDKILSICTQNLTPNGVAYVSYNTYPGWHLHGMVRDMMCYHAKRFDEPHARIRQARALIDFLAQSMQHDKGTYAAFLKEALEPIRQETDSYLLHEHLEEVNDPVYFHQFAERIAAKGLQYLGDVQFGTMLTSSFPPEVEATLRNLTQDSIQMEQYIDFLRNRSFRQSLLCHPHIALNRKLSPERLFDLHIAAPITPVSENPDLQSNAVVQFRGHNGALVSVSHPVTKAALVVLAEVWPQLVAFDALLAAARSRLGSVPQQDPTGVDQDSLQLAKNLAQCYAANVIELHVWVPPFVLNVSERPMITPLARLQAAAGPYVTNLRHEQIQFDQISRLLLPHLDGTRDRIALVNALAELLSKRVLKLTAADESVTDDERIRTELGGFLDINLARLARCAMLIG